MSEENEDRTPPVLGDLVKAAEPNSKQKFINYVLLGYGGNTAVAVTAVKLVRKFLPGLCEKWEARYAQKYYDRKFEEIVAPVADELNDASKAALEEKIKSDAKVYAEKTVSSRLLISGGFAMLPFQSAMEVSHHRENIDPTLNTFKDAATKAGYSTEETEGLLKQQIEQQKAQANGNKKSIEILDGAEKPPKFSPLGPSARKGLPKWGTGRILAIGSAFLVQGFVDDRFAKPKDAIDTMLAKIITKIVHPKGYEKDESFDNAAFAEHKAPKTTPEGVDPKVLDIVRMVTTDAYMTSVAIFVQSKSNNFWDKHFGEKGPLETLRDKFAGSGRSA